MVTFAGANVLAGKFQLNGDSHNGGKSVPTVSASIGFEDVEHRVSKHKAV
jgi:hypothetical protein